jgi:hypothetical protein
MDRMIANTTQYPKRYFLLKDLTPHMPHIDVRMVNTPKIMKPVPIVTTPSPYVSIISVLDTSIPPTTVTKMPAAPKKRLMQISRPFIVSMAHWMIWQVTIIYSVLKMHEKIEHMEPDRDVVSAANMWSNLEILE